MHAKLRAIKEELRRRRHDSISQQGQWLGQVVRGYFNYHAVPTNAKSLSAFRHHVANLWRQLRTPGSVRGVLSNEYSYHDNGHSAGHCHLL